MKRSLFLYILVSTLGKQDSVWQNSLRLHSSKQKVVSSWLSATILIIKLSLNHHLMALWAQTLFPFPRAYTALCYVRFGCVLLEMVWYWPLWQVVTWDFTSTAFVGTQVLVRASQNNTRSRSSIRMGLWTNFIFSNLRSYILWRN